MNVVIIDKDRYILLDTELPEIRDKIREISDIVEKYIAVPEKMKEQETANTVTFETTEGNVDIAVNDIISIEVYGNNCTVYTPKRKLGLKRGSLGNKLMEIGDNSILRCHKSYGINVRWLTGWRKKDRNLWEPVYRDEVDAPCLISRTYIDKVKSEYMQFHHGDKIEEV